MVQETIAWMNAGIAWTWLGPVEVNVCVAKQIPTCCFRILIIVVLNFYLFLYLSTNVTFSLKPHNANSHFIQ